MPGEIPFDPRVHKVVNSHDEIKSGFVPKTAQPNDPMAHMRAEIDDMRYDVDHHTEDKVSEDQYPDSVENKSSNDIEDSIEL
jgi:hypothetical protein